MKGVVDHIVDVTEMIEVGKSSKLQVKTVYLSRYTGINTNEIFGNFEQVPVDAKSNMQNMQIAFSGKPITLQVIL